MTGTVVDLDRLSAAGVRDGVLAGRSVTVLGLARSGIALARFFADGGCRVTVYDRRPPEELAPAIEALGSFCAVGFVYRLGGRVEREQARECEGR